MTNDGYFSLHTHTDYSNFRLIDSINKVSTLIDHAHRIGLNGIAITDHETLSGHVKAQKHLAKRKKENPDSESWQNFRLILGNEIYLCRNGLSESNFVGGQDKYYHFILLAKDEIGHKQLRELSSRAWQQSWYKFMRRVPTYYSDIEDIVGRSPGHVIGSTACLGGEVPQKILARQYVNNPEPINEEITNFLTWAQTNFGKDNFYLEMQPSYTEEQQHVNDVLSKIGKTLNIPIIITTDAHYLRAEDRPIHKSFLQSKNGEREVDEFYASTYLMTRTEIHEYMDSCFSIHHIDEWLNNTITIANECEEYDLYKPLRIPYMPLESEKLRTLTPIEKEQLIATHTAYPNFLQLLNSPYVSDVHLAKKIAAAGPFSSKQYEQLENEISALLITSEKTNVRWSAYLLQMSDYVKLFWDEANTLVGPGRGSGGGYFINYLLGITQIDPTREKAKTYYWRFLNPERASTLDIDIDIESNKRDQAIEVLKQHYGHDRVVKVMTVGMERGRAAIQTACRGLGVSPDVGIYLSSMVGSERGTPYTLSDTFYGNAEKNLAPNRLFVQEMTDNYPQVWELAQQIEGLISHVGVHAGGVIVVDEDFTARSAIMTTTKGELISQFELDDSEELGQVKIDALSIESLDKIRVCLDLLMEHGYVERESTLKETYEKVIGIYNLERNDLEMWKMLWENKVLSIFQMDQNSGIQAISLAQPHSVEELASLNSIMRLMASEKGAEQPLNKYARFKANPVEWEREMTEAGLTDEEQNWMKSYLALSYGLCAEQESLMVMLQDPMIGGHSLTFADCARRAIAKKHPAEFLECEAEFFRVAKEKRVSSNLANYVWRNVFSLQRNYSLCKKGAVA